MRKLALVLCLVSFRLCAGEAAAVEAAAKKAVAFLSAQQNADGTFGKGREAAMPGMTGLVLQSLVHGPGKPREDNNPVVKKAVASLLSKQQANGSFTVPRMGLENYNTAFAIMAIAPLENPAYREKLNKAKDFLVSGQYLGKQEEAGYGSFGYSPGQPGDLSNTSYALDAMAEMKVPVTENVWKNAMIYVRRCQDNPETNDLAAMKSGAAGTGGFVYKPVDSGEKVKAYGSMTYEGFRLLTLTTKGTPGDPALEASKKWIAKNYSALIHPGIKDTKDKRDDKTAYFYYIYGMSKALTESGQKEITLADGKKVNWAGDLAKHLISIQKPDGSFVNSSAEFMENSPILATGFALCALNECAKNLK